MSRFNLARRHWLMGTAAAATCWQVPGAFAEQLQPTARQTEGPFYPDHLPLDTDNDLIIVNNNLTAAVGEITWLSGKVLNVNGDPIRNAVVEIWQVDQTGAYLHTRSNGHPQRDTNFQGFGRFLTGSTGEYLFRTIRPVPYPGRTPHIHVAVKRTGLPQFTTQCYVQGEPQNERDGILNSVRDVAARSRLIVPFVPLVGFQVGELTAQFDIVLGETPAMP